MAWLNYPNKVAPRVVSRCDESFMCNCDAAYDDHCRTNECGEKSCFIDWWL